MTHQGTETSAAQSHVAPSLVLIHGSKFVAGDAQAAQERSAETASCAARELATRIRAGDKAAERELYLTYARGLRCIVLRRCADEQTAHDLVQDCFRIALTHLRAGKLDNPEALSGFMRGIAIKLVAEQLRDCRRERESYVDASALELVDHTVLPPPELLTREQLRALVRRLIAEMPVRRDRELLWRYYVLDHDKRVLCESLLLSPEHFDRVLHRARRRFRELAREHGLNTGTDT